MRIDEVLQVVKHAVPTSPRLPWQTPGVTASQSPRHGSDPALSQFRSLAGNGCGWQSMPPTLSWWLPRSCCWRRPFRVTFVRSATVRHGVVIGFDLRSYTPRHSVLWLWTPMWRIASGATCAPARRSCWVSARSRSWSAQAAANGVATRLHGMQAGWCCFAQRPGLCVGCVGGARFRRCCGLGSACTSPCRQALWCTSMAATRFSSWRLRA